MNVTVSNGEMKPMIFWLQYLQPSAVNHLLHCYALLCRIFYRGAHMMVQNLISVFYGSTAADFYFGSILVEAPTFIQPALGVRGIVSEETKKSKMTAAKESLEGPVFKYSLINCGSTETLSSN